MKKAILLPYAVDQNEPSRPINKIFEIPDDVDHRDQMLRDLFKIHVCDIENDFEADLSELDVTEGTIDDYGDLIVSYDDSMFLYVTFIDE